MWRRKSIGLSIKTRNIKTRGHTLCNRLKECCQHEAEVIAWVKPMPKCARSECGKTCSKTRLLPLWRDAKVHIMPQPMICVLIPVLEVGSRVLGGLYSPGIDVLKTVPIDLSSSWINAFVPHARKNASAFCQAPNAIVFHPSRKAKHL